MSTPDQILKALRAEMRRFGVTYAELAARVEMSESSIKRLMSGGELTLPRLAAFCAAVGTTLEDVLHQALEPADVVERLSDAQERSLVADPKTLLVAVCCLGQWTFEQMVATYRIEPPECIRRLVELDRLGLIELKPLNRYRLRVSPAFRWRPDGPVQQFFRDHVVPDYFDGRFDGPGETLLAVHGRLSPSAARELAQQIERLAAELARLHRDEHRNKVDERDGYTMVVALRSWEFGAFTALRRPEAAAPGPDADQGRPRNR